MTPHSSSVRGRYGVSFIIPYSEHNFSRISVVLCTLSCLIPPRYIENLYSITQYVNPFATSIPIPFRIRLTSNWSTKDNCLSLHIWPHLQALFIIPSVAVDTEYEISSFVYPWFPITILIYPWFRSKIWSKWHLRFTVPSGVPSLCP